MRKRILWSVCFFISSCFSRENNSEIENEIGKEKIVSSTPKRVNSLWMIALGTIYQ
jgi:hypothetical protein